MYQCETCRYWRALSRGSFVKNKEFAEPVIMVCGGEQAGGVMTYIPDLSERDYPIDTQAQKPITYCASCGGEVYAGDVLYEWDNATPDICEHCFKEKASELSASQLAEAMGMGVRHV